MTATADELRAAAFLLRNLMGRPELAAAIDLPYTEPLADWLDYEADLMGPGSERRGRTGHALAVARAINGGEPR